MRKIHILVLLITAFIGTALLASAEPVVQSNQVISNQVQFAIPVSINNNNYNFGSPGSSAGTQDITQLQAVVICQANSMNSLLRICT